MDGSGVTDSTAQELGVRGLSSTSEMAPPEAMYTKLRPRPNGPGRSEVARNQRLRLYGAMVEAVATHGYSGTTVTELTALAGISRRTFYEQFENKEACFLWTYDLVVKRAIARAGKAWLTDGDWITRLRCSFEAFAAVVVEHPKAARLGAVEVLAAGPAGVRRAEHTSLIFERMITTGFEASPEGGSPSPVVVKGIVGGFWRVIRKRLIEGDVERLPELVEELLAWALQYRCPGAIDLPRDALASAGREQVASERAAADRRVRRDEAVGEDERVRILRATAWIAARAGHTQLTIGQIIQQADVSEQVFLSHFENSTECFLETVNLLASEALALAVEASLDADDWQEGIYLGLAALLRKVADDPIFARVAFVEVFAAGTAGSDDRARLMHAFTELFAARVPQPAKLSEPVIEAMVGAVWQIAHHYVVRNTAHRLPGLAPSVAYMVLAPIVGAEAAVKNIVAMAERF